MGKILILGSFLFLNCIFSNSRDYELSTDRVLKNLNLNKVYEYTLDGDSTLLIGRLHSSFQASDDKKTFVFFDETRTKFIITDSLGLLKKVFGSQGKGPSELERVQTYTLSEKNVIYAYDFGQFMIKKYSTAGEYLESYSVEPHGVGVYPFTMAVRSGQAYLGIVMSEYLSDLYSVSGTPQIAVIDGNGEMAEMFGHYDSYSNASNNYSIAPLLTLSPDRQVLMTTQMNSFLIQGWDVNGKQRIFTTHTKPPHFNLGKDRINPFWSRQEIERKSVNLSYSDAVYITDDYIILLYSTLTEKWFATSDTDRQIQYMALFDKEGDLVGELELPNRVANIINNRLHLILDDNPDNYTLGVYELEVE